MLHCIVFLTFLVLFLASTSCTFDETRLPGTNWTLASMDTYLGPDIPAVGEVTLRFDENGNEFEGDTGCNSYRGRYRVEGSLFRVLDARWTEAGCPTDALFEQEQVLQEVFSSAYEFFLEGPQLTITAVGGRSLTFASSPRLTITPTSVAAVVSATPTQTPAPPPPRGVVDGYEDTNNRAGGAVSDFDVAILLDPESAEAYHNRGLTHAEMGNPLRALEDLTRAIELDPRDPTARYDRGMVQRDLNERVLAVRDFDAAVGLEPDFGLAIYARGITYVNLGAFEEALRDFDAVLGLDPDNAPALLGRGVALGNLERCEEAIESFDRSLELEPGNAEALSGRGLAHGSLGRYELAVADYAGAIELDPGNADVRYNR